MCGLDFHGSPLATFEHAGERWVVMRPVVEGMGLNWSGQYTKLRSAEKRWGLRVFGYPNTSGGVQETLCIPLKRYPGWVNAINPAKIPDPAVRQRVELYQDASAEALYQFWATGAATSRNGRGSHSGDAP
ncbi:phage antirepressor N-terminal domain-containing protein [Methylobacterium oryzae CBMB20]